MNRTLSNNRTARGAFTLIELLVVVAIIALLMAILMPALARARSQAKSLKCLANLRSIGVAFATNLAENENRYPVQPTTGGRGSQWDAAHPTRNLTNGTWWGILAPNLNWTRVDWSNPNSPNYSDHSASNTIGQCPEFGDRIKGSFIYWANQFVVVDPDSDRISGTWSYPLGWGKGVGLKANLVTRPTDKVLVFEVFTNSSWPITSDGTARGQSPFTQDAATGYSNGARAVHGPNNNYLFCDGHAESIKDAGLPSAPMSLPVQAGATTNPKQCFRIES